MQQATEPVICKIGAMGLIAIGLPNRQVGIAIKTTTGDEVVRDFATFAVLEHWFPGLIAKGVSAPWRLVRNVVGDVVGERVFDLGR